MSRRSGISWGFAMTTDVIPELPEYNDSALDQAFAALAKQATDEASAISGPDGLEAFRLRWLGRKQGRLNDVSARWLKAAPPEAKKARRRALQDAEGSRRAPARAGFVGSGPSDAALAAEAIDITLPGTRRLTGAEHPITRTLNEIVSVFASLWVLRRRRSRSRNRLLQLRVHELPAGPSGARHAGHARRRQPGAPPAARPPAAAHPHLARADAHHGAAAAARPHRDPRQGAPQRRRTTPRTRRSFTRSKASASTPISPSAT